MLRLGHALVIRKIKLYILTIARNATEVQSRLNLPREEGKSNEDMKAKLVLEKAKNKPSVEVDITAKDATDQSYESFQDQEVLDDKDLQPQEGVSKLVAKKNRERAGGTVWHGRLRHRSK